MEKKKKINPLHDPAFDHPVKSRQDSHEKQTWLSTRDQFDLGPAPPSPNASDACPHASALPALGQLERASLIRRWASLPRTCLIRLPAARALTLLDRPRLTDRQASRAHSCLLASSWNRLISASPPVSQPASQPASQPVSQPRQQHPPSSFPFFIQQIPLGLSGQVPFVRRTWPKLRESIPHTRYHPTYLVSVVFVQQINRQHEWL